MDRGLPTSLGSPESASILFGGRMRMTKQTEPFGIVRPRELKSSVPPLEAPISMHASCWTSATPRVVATPITGIHSSLHAEF